MVRFRTTLFAPFRHRPAPPRSIHCKFFDALSACQRSLSLTHDAVVEIQRASMGPRSRERGYKELIVEPHSEDAMRQSLLTEKASKNTSINQ